MRSWPERVYMAIGVCGLLLIMSIILVSCGKLPHCVDVYDC